MSNDNTNVTVRIRDNGPLVVEGPITVLDSSGNKYSIPAEKPAVALCRCGASKNKPFCDGAHKTCGFDSAPRVPQAS